LLSQSENNDLLSILEDEEKNHLNYSYNKIIDKGLEKALSKLMH
jgi:hypothetical protein